MYSNTVTVMGHQKRGSSALQVELHCEEYVVLLVGANSGKHIHSSQTILSAKHRGLSMWSMINDKLPISNLTNPPKPDQSCTDLAEISDL